MARNYSPKRFANVGILKKMDFPLLLRLLEPYRLYFEGHSDFGWSTEPDQFRFDILAEMMLNLDMTIPKELLEGIRDSFIVVVDLFDGLDVVVALVAPNDRRRLLALANCCGSHCSLSATGVLPLRFCL